MNTAMPAGPDQPKSHAVRAVRAVRAVSVRRLNWNLGRLPGGSWSGVKGLLTGIAGANLLRVHPKTPHPRPLPPQAGRGEEGLG